MPFRLALALLCLVASVAAQFTPDVVVYTDATSATHQFQVGRLAAQGYRPISLSVAGSQAGARYAAVWIRRAGPAFVMVHGVDAAGYDAWRTQQRTSGFRPSLVACSGATGSEVYAGVYVADGVDAVEHIELLESDLLRENSRAYDNDRVLRCVSARGSGIQMRFAAVYEPNVDEDAWCWEWAGPADYSIRFAARAGAYGRLVSAQRMPNGGISQLWTDSATGGFDVRTQLTSTQLTTEIANQRANGWYPTSIQQYSTGPLARFEVVFAPRDRPLPRTFTRTGQAVIPMGGFDQYIEEHMRAHGIRSSAIAITKDGRLVFARGYTFAEAGYPLTQPTSMFRVASLSKTVTGLAVNLLIQRGALAQSTRAGPYLGLTSSQPDFANIELLHLLQHRSGFVGDNTSWGVASLLDPNNPTLPVSAWQTAQAIARRPMTNALGSTYRYTNLGYYLLGSVVEQASGKSYERFLREDLAAPLGITRMWVGGNERHQLRSGEVEPRNRYLELTPSEVHTDRRIVPVQFGGGGDDNLTRRAGAGGVLTSPVDYVRLFSGALDLACDGTGILDQAAVDRMLAEPDPRGGANAGGFDTREVRPNGVVAYGKDGALWGSSTQFIYRSDGVAIAVFDGYQNSQADRGRLNALADAVTDWPTHDLFPSYGLPLLPRVCPRIHGVANDTLANLTDSAFRIDGDVLSNVDRVTFGSRTITSRSSTTWADGWFEIVSDDRIDVHPPQGMVPGGYALRLHSGSHSSAPVNLTLIRTSGRLLGGPSVAFVGFDMYASRGGSSVGSAALLCFSTSASPSLLPGIVDLGIGAGFSQLWAFPSTVPFNPLTGCARWSVPDFGQGLLHFQAIVVDPNATNQPPFPVTPVRSVRGV